LPLPSPGRAPAIPVLHQIGQFDPAILPGFSALTAVPLETYNPPAATGADTEPPLLLTTLASLPAFTDSGAFAHTDSTAPISTIRVRVAAVSGPDAVSRERVREVAQTISARTGLDVDITLGSSLPRSPLTCPPASTAGPRSRSMKGGYRRAMVVAILSAVDRKSVLLFALILVVCGLFIANAAGAGVRARRSELGVLASLGWKPRQVFTVVLGELAVIGLVAGAVGTLIAFPLSAAFSLHPSVTRAAIAVPATVLLAFIAGAIPALQASHSSPAAAVRPPSNTAAGAPTRTVAPLAVTNLLRVPVRTVLGVVSVAVGVAALTLVLAITLAFRGAVVGSLLGDAVSLQIRGVDYLAVAVTVFLRTCWESVGAPP